MTIRILLVIFIGSIMFSCNSVTGGDHLSRKKMEDILYDISIAEAYSTKTKDNANFGGLKNMDTLAGYYKDILAHHRISKQEFEESLAWYKARPDEIDSIYTDLSVKADKVNAAESKKRKQLPPPTPAIQAGAMADTHNALPRRRLIPRSVKP